MSRNRSTRWSLAAAVLAVAVASVPTPRAGAEEAGFPGDVPDRFRLRLSTVSGSFDTNFAYSTDRGGLGGLVNFENLLGVESTSNSFRVEGSWRIGRRSSIEFGYFGFNRSGSRAPQQDFQFLIFTILAGTAVETDLSSKVATAAFRYNAYDNGEVRLYGTAGASYFDLETSLIAGVGVLLPGGVPLGRGFVEAVDVSQVVPILGVGTEWAVSRRFLTNLYFRGLFLDLGDFRGGISEAGLSGTWYFTRHLGVGAGVQRVDIRVREFETGSSTARGSYSQVGVLLYLEAAF
jgi:hypothetical protein